MNVFVVRKEEMISYLEEMPQGLGEMIAEFWNHSEKLSWNDVIEKLEKMVTKVAKEEKGEN